MKAEFIFELEKDAELIYNSLKLEEKMSLTRAEIYLNESTLKIVINASNLAELRAATNSWLRFVKICLDSLEVLEWENYHLNYRI